MIYILHYLNDPRLWELWYIPYYGDCRIYIINRSCQTGEDAGPKCLPVITIIVGVSVGGPNIVP